MDTEKDRLKPQEWGCVVVDGIWPQIPKDHPLYEVKIERACRAAAVTQYAIDKMMGVEL